MKTTLILLGVCLVAVAVSGDESQAYASAGGAGKEIASESLTQQDKDRQISSGAASAREGVVMSNAGSYSYTDRRRPAKEEPIAEEETAPQEETEPKEDTEAEEETEPKEDTEAGEETEPKEDTEAGEETEPKEDEKKE